MLLESYILIDVMVKSTQNFHFLGISRFQINERYIHSYCVLYISTSWNIFEFDITRFFIINIIDFLVLATA